MQRPQKDGSHYRLLKLNRDRLFLQPAIYFTTFLPFLHQLCNYSAALAHPILDQAAYNIACQERRNHRARKSGAAPRFFHQADRHSMQQRMNCLLIFGSMAGNLPDLGELNLRHYPQHVILRIEVIEESSLADVGSLCNIAHRNVCKTPLGEKLNRAAEEAQARGCCSPLSTAHAMPRPCPTFRESLGASMLTVNHMRPKV